MFGVFPKILVFSRAPSYFPFSSIFVLFCMMAGVILGRYFTPTLFQFSILNNHFSGPNFSKAQAVQLIQKLSVEERRIFLKELKKVPPALKHVQLTVSSLFRLTRDNHVQTNQHRGNYDSLRITTLFPSSALASSTTSS